MKIEKEARLTNHNGRTRKNGEVFSAKHNDRNFDLEKAPHINGEIKNLYWKNPDLGIDINLSFDDFEAAFYKKEFEGHLETVKESATKNRHLERIQTSEEYRHNPRSCPEETLIYFGDKDHELSPRLFAEMAIEFMKWKKDTFPNRKILDFAIHFDEQGAPHVHERAVWIASDKQGNAHVSQNKALKEMGFENKGLRRDNAKMKFSEMCRAKQIEIAREHGIDIQTTPKLDNGFSLKDYIAKTEAIQDRLEFTRQYLERMNLREHFKEQFKLFMDEKRAQAKQQSARVRDIDIDFEDFEIEI